MVIANTKYLNIIYIMAKKRYRVEVAFQGERYVIVRANNERQAKSLAQKRVRKMVIGSSVRTDWTEAEVDPYLQ